MMFHLGILENLPIKVGDFYVVDDFSILDMFVDAYTRVINICCRGMSC